MIAVLYPTRDEVIDITRAACGFDPVVGDEALLQAAIARPKTSAFAEEAYPSLFCKAGALMHSLAKNHPLVDGNKRAAWNSAWFLLGMNGVPIADRIDAHDAYRFVIAVATADLDWRTASEGLARFAR